MFWKPDLDGVERVSNHQLSSSGQRASRQILHSRKELPSQKGSCEALIQTLTQIMHDLDPP